MDCNPLRPRATRLADHLVGRSVPVGPGPELQLLELIYTQQNPALAGGHPVRFGKRATLIVSPGAPLAGGS
ncbi:hypothetical protein GCM10010298_70140 [Streptomyces microflavus]|uniref:Uncharacterized protein n=1 Tax=Streptomyces microflavus TaxID=1919 RepID=A0A7J0D4W8_STRMI|nr:hypothetical protein Smic_83280 [Streptomyces microflavus]GGX94726.1 hypothetical protein GCM10010298_70140 [Streptomyces microflavus]